VLFGVVPLPDWVAVDRELSNSLKPLHHWLAYALGGVVALHVAGALKHLIIDRDQLLQRMLPARFS
jgi:cytochrome b561